MLLVFTVVGETKQIFNTIRVFYVHFRVFFLSQTEEPAKTGACARDRRALQQLALNVHVKHSDLT